jgi:hypothetical protein
LKLAGPIKQGHFASASLQNFIYTMEYSQGSDTFLKEQLSQKRVIF